MYRQAARAVAVLVLLVAGAPREVAAPPADAPRELLRLEQRAGTTRHALQIEIDCRADGEARFRIGPFELAEPVFYEFDNPPAASCNACDLRSCD